MKQIYLKQYSFINGTYQVTLGNGIYREFANKKKCLKFLVDCNRYLTFKLIEVNGIYISLLTQYRRNWFYFDHNKNPGFTLYEADRLCRRNLDSISKTLDVMVERSNYQNGNHFVFSHFRIVLSDMKKIIAYLQALMRSKSNAVDVHELQLILLSVLKMENEIASFDGTLPKEESEADAIMEKNRMRAV